MIEHTTIIHAAMTMSRDVTNCLQYNIYSFAPLLYLRAKNGILIYSGILERMNVMLRDIVTDKRRLFEDGAESELRCQENRARAVSVVSGNLTANTRSEVSGVSARVYKNGVSGFSSEADLTKEAAERVLKAATENADFMDSRVRKGTGPLPRVGGDPVIKPCEISDPEQKVYIDLAREVDAYIEKKYPNLRGRGISVRADSMEKFVCASGGADGHTVIPRCYVYVRMTADSPSGSPVELFVPVGGYGTVDTVFASASSVFSAADELFEKLMRKREGVYAEAGLKTCILGGELAGMLSHEAVGHTVEADLVLGGSVAAHSLGKQVASELVTMVDYAHTAFGKPTPLPVYIDDEGVKAEDQTLIQDGVLVGYMNNRDTAKRFGMKPRGNARAYLFSDEPLIRMRNTAIVPGKSKLEEMIESVEDGYYFLDTNNGQADTTGEFMFGICMGYEIKKGRLGRAILDTTISGVAFEMLKSVDMISDNMHWASSGFCGKKQPMPVGLGGPEVRCKVNVGGR